MFNLTITPFVGGFFWAFTALFIFGYWFIEKLKPNTIVKNLYMIAVSLFIITMVQASENRLFFLIFILVITIMIFLVGKSLLLGANQNRAYICSAGIIFITLLLCFFKYDNFQRSIISIFNNPFSNSNRMVFIVGVYYISLNYIQFLIECYKIKISPFSFVTCLN